MTRVVVLLGLLVSLAACSSAESDAPIVSMTEFGISVDGAFTGEPVDVAVHNEGEFAHTLVVADADGTVVVATDVIGPGEMAEVGLDLAPGEYEFSCRIVVETGEGHIVDHYGEGMVQRVVVG